MRVTCTIWIALCLAPVSSHTQQGPHGTVTLTGIPFTAKVRSTVTHAARAGHPQKVEVSEYAEARASDGSLYEARLRDGKPVQVSITSIPLNKNFVLNMETHTYFLFPEMLHRNEKIRTYGTEYRELTNKYFDVPPPSIDMDHPPLGTTRLGRRDADGMMLYGQVLGYFDSPQHKETARVWWISDLGFTWSYRENTPDVVCFTEQMYDLKREEPDPQLFKIPSGFRLVPTPNPYTATGLQSAVDPPAH